MLQAVANALPHLPAPVTVQFGAGKFSCDGCKCVAFLDMDTFITHVQEATVLIIHGGAGTVINAIHAGKVPIVVPRLARFGEHVDDHQLEFARALGAAGKVVVVEEVGDLPEAINAIRNIGSRRPEAITPSLTTMVDAALKSYAKKYGL
jgi:UDP-N-acetylglucosamine transferase subunit ALG13